jgi:hypothetical protein
VGPRPGPRRPAIGASDRPLRVVHIIDSLGSGGAEHNLVNLLAAVERGAFEHHVVALYRDDTLARRLREAGAAVSVLGGRGPRDAPRLLTRLSSAIKGANPALVHTQLVTSDLLGRAAVLLSARRPVLSTLQNRPYDPVAISTEFPTAFLSGAIRRADRWLGARTKTRYIAVSEGVRSSTSASRHRPRADWWSQLGRSLAISQEGVPSGTEARRALLGLRGNNPSVSLVTRQKGLSTRRCDGLIAPKSYGRAAHLVPARHAEHPSYISARKLTQRLTEGRFGIRSSGY